MSTPADTFDHQHDAAYEARYWYGRGWASIRQDIAELYAFRFVGKGRQAALATSSGWIGSIIPPSTPGELRHLRHEPAASFPMVDTYYRRNQ